MKLDLGNNNNNNKCDIKPQKDCTLFIIVECTFFCREHFIQVNGMSNKYWGWGLEDDEFYVRLKEAGFSVSRPQNISTGTHNTFR